jgi:ring-1,2-phenylacetyl-CoA epoxidase subunit PaaD
MATTLEPGLLERVRAELDAVVDPEIPVLTIADLGVLRDVAVEDGRLVVTITPTYSGCPAMDVIRADVAEALRRAGCIDAEVRTVLAPAWTTDWISEQGREKLAGFGIAPPRRLPTAPVLCPRCRSARTTTVSEFGSTACKALMVCASCGEPFDRFKEL